VGVVSISKEGQPGIEFCKTFRQSVDLVYKMKLRGIVCINGNVYKDGKLFEPESESRFTPIPVDPKTYKAQGCKTTLFR